MYVCSLYTYSHLINGSINESDNPFNKQVTLELSIVGSFNKRVGLELRVFNLFIDEHEFETTPHLSAPILHLCHRLLYTSWDYVWLENIIFQFPLSPQISLCGSQKVKDSSWKMKNNSFVEKSHILFLCSRYLIPFIFISLIFLARKQG